MGFEDRDYYREPPRSQATGLRMWSVTTWLIAINVAVYLLNLMTVRHEYFGDAGVLYRWGNFSATTALQGMEVWRFLTFQFLHASPSHIFFNMLSLYFFGPLVENYLGSKRYLAFYLLCGLSGAVSYLLLLGLGILTGANAPMVGASAGIFGVLIAGAAIAPNVTVMMIFPPIPMRLKTFAWVMLGIATWTVLFNGKTPGKNAGGEAAHLGGAALGALLIRYPKALDVFDLGARRRRFRPPGNSEF